MFGARAAVVSAMFLIAGSIAAVEPRGSIAPLAITRYFTPADRVTGRYQYVPFDVPHGTGTLKISYQYDRANGGNVVDLGLFEPGPLDLGTRAFRGYSGGARSTLIISADETTPGYRPGPLPAGRWHVLLGLYKVSEAGVDVTVTVETGADTAAIAPVRLKPDATVSAPVRLKPDTAAIAPVRLKPDATGSAPVRLKPDTAAIAPVRLKPDATVSAPVRLTASAQASAVKKPDATGGGPRWLRGALHTHTLHSDGTVSPAELMRLAREAKFDFVVITDHNNTTHTYDPALASMDRKVGLKADTTGPLWIVGEEVTTPGGHANVWGLKAGDWVDFRVAPGEKRIGELVAAARRQGGVFAINHPASECVGCGWEHDVVEGIEAIEISNGRHGEVAKALAIWDRLLVTGRRITGIGSSDWHAAPNAIDVANVRVYADAVTQPAILAAIRRGRVIVMGRAADDTPELIVRAGDRSARSGESLSVAAATAITVEVTAPELSGGRGTLVVVSDGKRSVGVPLDAHGQITIRERADGGYIRFELYAADGALFAATNPVYFVRP